MNARDIGTSWRTLAFAAALLGLVVAAATPVIAEDPPSTAKPYAIGDTISDFSLKDSMGNEFSLSSARQITEEQALDSVRNAAKDFGGTSDLKSEDTFDKVSGLKGTDGSLDAKQKELLVTHAGRTFGLVPDSKRVEEMKTLGDVSSWIRDAVKAPIVFEVWSPNDATVQSYDSRLRDLATRSGFRVYQIHANTKVSDESINEALKTSHLPWRVLMDRDMSICNKLGCQRTSQVLLLDADNVLRYSGAIDDDPSGQKAEGERKNWLSNAIEAVKSGTQPDPSTTQPQGTPLVQGS